MQARLVVFAAVAVLVPLGFSSCNRERPSVSTGPAKNLEVPRVQNGKPTAVVPSHALLVGCTRYPNLPARFALQGPANDVLLVRKVLLDKFGFADKNVVLLSETAGQVQGKMYFPTRQNIEREFKRLAKVAEKGHQVVIWLSGHGSQQPEPNPPPDPQFAEPDGLDEVFLPEDAGVWDKKGERIANAIVDDEFRVWTDAIVRNGAFLFFVADCCHSGTLLRGSEVERQIKPRDLQIPKEEMAAAEKRAAARGKNPEDRDTPFHMDKVAGKLAAIYACRSSEPTVELLLPRESADAKPYGLLTYHLCQILTGSQSSLTYRELGQRIKENYDRLGRDFPMPLVEGNGRDFKVLGKEEFKGRSLFFLSKNEDDRWQINGGFLHSFTKNSVFALYPPSGAPDADKIVGHVKITAVGPVTAVVKPCAFGSTLQNDNLAKGSRCEPVFVDFGDLQLRVALDTADAQGKTLPVQDLKAAAALLEKLAKEKGSLIQVSDLGKADWLLRLDKQGAYLLPARGVLRKIGSQDILLGPFGADLKDPETADNLRELLLRIARVANLRRLAGTSSGGGVGNIQPLKVEILKFADKQDEIGKVLPFNPDLTFRDGDIIAFQLTNPKESTRRYYVSLLYLDAGYDIAALYPEPNDAQEPLVPGRSIKTRRMQVQRPWGLESVLAIAVPATGQPIDFTVLAKPSLPSARGSERGTRALNTPLGLLLQNACYGEGERGAKLRDFDEHGLQLLSWQALPR